MSHVLDTAEFGCKLPRHLVSHAGEEVTTNSEGQNTANPARVIDTDSHVTEPRDLWTSRMTAERGDLVLHARWIDDLEREAWFIGDQRVAGQVVHSQFTITTSACLRRHL
jgi:hypothetical protein